MDVYRPGRVNRDDEQTISNVPDYRYSIFSIHTLVAGLPWYEASYISVCVTLRFDSYVFQICILLRL